MSCSQNGRDDHTHQLKLGLGANHWIDKLVPFPFIS